MPLTATTIVTILSTLFLFAVSLLWLRHYISHRLSPPSRIKRPRHAPLGFSSETPLAFGEIRLIEQAHSAFAFWGERLIVPSNTAGSFRLRRILVDGVAASPARGASFPSEGFSCADFTELGSRFNLFFGESKRSIGLMVVNVDPDGAPQVFRAVVIGRVMYDEFGFEDGAAHPVVRDVDVELVADEEVLEANREIFGSGSGDSSDRG